MAAEERTRQSQGTGAHTCATEQDHTLIFSGTSQLPAKACAPGGSGVLTLEVAVDRRSMTVVDAACGGVPTLGARLVADLLVGRPAEPGLRLAAEQVRLRYFHTCQRALVAAIEDVQRCLREFARRQGEAHQSEESTAEARSQEG